MWLRQRPHQHRGAAPGGSTPLLLKVDLTDAAATAAAVQQADPDLVLHLAAESHVDGSIEGPGAFIESNVSGTFQLLQAVRAHWEGLSAGRQAGFRFHHISTDEVFGSLGATGRFSETTPYDPRSPYSASKAASDHLVNAWHHTYGLPVVLTNCSNNYGPWQFPEKLAPTCATGSTWKTTWMRCCVGGHGERTNKEVVEVICSALDDLLPAGTPHSCLVTTGGTRLIQPGSAASWAGCCHQGQRPGQPGDDLPGWDQLEQPQLGGR
jgi:dTDP-glucose 4,6-dehydratase